MMETKNIADMTSTELKHYLAATEHKHRAYMRALRALLRVREAEDAK